MPSLLMIRVNISQDRKKTFPVNDELIVLDFKKKAFCRDGVLVCLSFCWLVVKSLSFCKK